MMATGQGFLQAGGAVGRRIDLVAVEKENIGEPRANRLLVFHQ